jgi:hypothetical protein
LSPPIAQKPQVKRGQEQPFPPDQRAALQAFDGAIVDCLIHLIKAAPFAHAARNAAPLAFDSMSKRVKLDEFCSNPITRARRRSISLAEQTFVPLTSCHPFPFT